MNPDIHRRLRRFQELMEREGTLSAAGRLPSASQLAVRWNELRGGVADAPAAVGVSRKRTRPVRSPGDEQVIVSRRDLECLVEHVTDQDRGIFWDLCCPDALERLRDALMPAEEGGQA